MNSDKKQLRQTLLQDRLALEESLRLQYTRQIVDQLKQVPCIQAAGTILAYLPVRGEASLVEFCEWALKRGQNLALPRSIRATHTIEVVPVSSLDQLIRGEYGILEPDAGRQPLDPVKVDVFLVPGVAFDPQGGRLGYGAGYYDRLFERMRPDAVKIGICFELQLAGSVPHEAHDIRMDAVVTERRMLVVNRAMLPSSPGDVSNKE